jgi:chromosome segregation ATPase
MIKKLLIVGGIVAVVGLLLFGRGAASYLRTSAHRVSEAVSDAVPIEFQIDRARDMIKDLVPEIRKNMHVIAKEEVEVARLQEQIDQTKTRLDKEKEQLLKLKADLSSGKANFQYCGRSYTADQVKTDLSNRFERFKTGDATLASLQQIHGARQRSLEAARQKLDGMMAAKRQLQVDVENLEARVQMLAAAQTTSNYQFDDSRLGQTKELIAGLRTRLDVAERLVNVETKFAGEIPVGEPAPENVVEEVTEYFGGKAKDATQDAVKVAAAR